MTEELWTDKVTLKKSLGIDETRLVEFVSQRILTPYMKHTDGKYYSLPFKKEEFFYREEPHPSRWMRDQLPIVKVRHSKWIDTTKEQIAEGLKTFIWFKQIDIDDAEYEGKIKLTEKPQEETKTMSLS